MAGVKINENDICRITTVSIPTKQLERFKVFAREKRLSVSQLLRDSAQRHIDGQKGCSHETA